MLGSKSLRKERRGYWKKTKRKLKNEIVISQTDKSQEITISSYESYMQQGEIHIQKDKLSTWKEVKEDRDMVIDHTKAMSKIFCMGENHGETNQHRLTDALHERQTVLPDLVLQQKDHKPVDP